MQDKLRVAGRWLATNWKIIAALISTIAFTAGAAVTITDENGDGTPDRVVIERVVAPAGDLQASPVGPGAVSKKPAESELRDDTPPDVPAATLNAGREKTAELAAPLPDTPQPVGGAQAYSCKQDFSGHVYSDFPGTHPTEVDLHYTVSPNVTGWGDILGVQAFFKRTMAASATYIVDFEGHCLQMVPLDHKSWAAGAANPYTRASIEVIATGRETTAQWLASPLIKGRILSGLVGDLLTRYGLPKRFVDPVGCVFPPGYTDHNHLECGNDHTDVSPYFPFAEFQRQLVEHPQVHVTSRDRADCHNVHAYRLRRRAHKPKTRTGTAAFDRRLARVKAHGVRCVDGRAVTR